MIHLSSMIYDRHFRLFIYFVPLVSGRLVLLLEKLENLNRALLNNNNVKAKIYKNLRPKKTNQNNRTSRGELLVAIFKCYNTRNGSI